MSFAFDFVCEGVHENKELIIMFQVLFNPWLTGEFAKFESKFETDIYVVDVGARKLNLFEIFVKDAP